MNRVRFLVSREAGFVMTEKNAGGGSLSLIRGLRLIEFLSDYANGCPLSRIAGRTGLNKSTAHRMLKSLQTLGYVIPATTPGSYRLTGKFVAVGHKVFSSLNVINVAAPHLEKLNLDTGHTVNLSAREGNNYILIYKLEPTDGVLRTHFYIGQRLILYCSGMGKAYLAHSPDAFLEKYWSEERAEIVRRTPNTIVDIAAMRKELARIRREGVSYDREENELGVICVAAPVFGLHRRVGYAISVTVPASRTDRKRLGETGGAVRETAALISHEMGGTLF